MDTNYPVVMYNTNTQTIVAIFKGATFASKYIFGKAGIIRTKTILKKQRYTTIYDEPVTFRSANKEYSDKLGDKDYLILDKSYELRNSIERKAKSFGNDMNASVFKGKNKQRVINRDKEITRLAKQGCIPSEIANMTKIKEGYVTNIARKNNVILLPEIVKSYDLKQLIGLLKIRITLLKTVKNS